MLPPIFYADPDLIVNEQVVLGKEDSHHAVTVMRLKPPEIVIVIDGQGTAYRGEIINIDRKKLVTVKFHSTIRNFGETSSKVCLAIGMSANYKLDTVIQKGTELGVKRFVPLLTEKSKIKLNSSKKKYSKVKRLEKIALSAIKQCRRSYIPEISEPVKFNEYLKQTEKTDLNLIFHTSYNSEKFNLNSIDKSLKRINLLVGPESGFSNDEYELALEAGFKTVSLGDRILRTETAGIIISGVVMYLLNELS